MSDVTQVLSRIEAGDRHASSELLPLVYDELRRLAAHWMSSERPDHTLQATALVHEAYLRLIDVEASQHWDSRRHFFGAAAEAMRRILVERARKSNRRAEIRGARVSLEDFDCPSALSQDQVLSLNEALDKLESQNSAAASVVKLKFFAGLTLGQAARALDISQRTAQRHWTYARVWLHRELDEAVL